MKITSLRSGDWITPERIRVYSIFSILTLLCSIAYFLVTAEGINDYKGRPLGTDFSGVYAAGSYALEGKPATGYNPVQEHTRQQEIFGSETPFYGWSYPPLFLLVACALAALPYGAALGVWLATSFTAYLATMRAILPMRAALLPICGFTAIWVNTTHGNNGFLTAALFGGALAFLPKRPVLAGLLIACLAYKPQYGILIPLTLIAGGYYRAFFCAAAGVLILIAVSIVVFGTEPWHALVDYADFTQTVLLEQGETGFYKMQSLFAWVRFLGGSIPLAYALQGALTLAVAIITARLWRSSISFERKAASLMLATLLAVPYSMDYDLMLMAPVIAFLVRDGLRDRFTPYIKTALAFAWIAPLLTRSMAQTSGIFLGFLSIAMLFAFVLQNQAHTKTQ